MFRFSYIMIMISLLIPTFNRPNNIKSLIESVNDTVFNFSSVEIIFGTHSDDSSSNNMINIVQSKVPIIKTVIDRYCDGKPHLSFFWNQTYACANGDILGFFGDDVIFRTKNWDVEIEKEFRDDWKKLVSCNDCYIHGGERAVLFFTHRKTHDLFGFYMYPEFRRWFMDTFWDKIFRDTGKMTVRRDIHTAHYHPERFPERLDDVYKNMDGFKGNDDRLWNSPEMKEKLKKYTEIFKNA